MKKIMLFLIVLTTAFGCAATGPTNPPEGAFVVQSPAFPPPGTKFSRHYKSEKDNYTSHFKVIEDGVFGKKPVHRVLIESNNAIILFDPNSGNYIATIDKTGEVLQRVKPNGGFLNFPLFVGKRYRSSFYLKKKGWSGDVWYNLKVTAYEKVTVPRRVSR